MKYLLKILVHTYVMHVDDDRCDVERDIIIECVCNLTKQEYILLLCNSEQAPDKYKAKRVLPKDYDDAGGDCCTQQMDEICAWCKYHPKILSVEKLTDFKCDLDINKKIIDDILEFLRDGI